MEFIFPSGKLHRHIYSNNTLMIMRSLNPVSSGPVNHQCFCYRLCIKHFIKDNTARWHFNEWWNEKTIPEFNWNASLLNAVGLHHIQSTIQYHWRIDWFHSFFCLLTAAYSLSGLQGCCRITQRTLCRWMSMSKVNILHRSMSDQ